MIRVVRDFRDGIRLLLEGFRIVFGNGRLLRRAALPVLLTSVLLLAAIVALVVYAGDLAAWATPFADDWSGLWQDLVRVTTAVAMVAAGLALSVLLFTGLTLAIGGPFYESIAEEVEDSRLGGVRDAENIGWARSAANGIRDTAQLIVRSLLYSIPLVIAGFIPVVGQTVVPVLAVCVQAWLLGVELTGIPFSRRGRTLAERRTTLRRSRSMTLGFAIPVYLLCLVPFAALAVLPAAMAGGTLLAHRLLERERAA